MSDTKNQAAYDKAQALFRMRHPCNCAAVDIGVGIQHEPGCGDPGPDEVADLIEATEAETARLRAELGSAEARLAHARRALESCDPRNAASCCSSLDTALGHSDAIVHGFTLAVRDIKRGEDPIACIDAALEATRPHLVPVPDELRQRLEAELTAARLARRVKGVIHG